MQASTSVAVLVGGLILVVACTSTDSSGNSTVADSVAEPLASTSTAPAATTMPDPEEAHILDGQWLFTYVLDSFSDNFSATLDPGDRDLFIVTMSQTCEIGPCDVKALFDSPYREDDPGEFTMEWTEGTYVLTNSSPGLGDCAAEGEEFLEGALDLTVTLRLSPSDYEADSSVWRVTGLEGTRTADWIPTEAAAAMGCEPSVEEYTVNASVYDPSLFSVPASEPLPPGTLTFRERSAEGEGLTARLPDGSERSVPGISTPYVLSPDGGSVVYRGTFGLWITDLEGSAAFEFFPEARVLPSSELAWSSDGSQVAFVRRSLEEGADVWLVEIPYGVPERLTWGGQALGGVTWGPGDDSLLFDWGVYEEVPGNPPTFAAQSTIFSYDFSSEEIVEIVANGFRPSIGDGGESLTYLVPDFDRLGRPIRWSITTSDPTGDNSRVLIRAALSHCGSGDRPIPCSAPISPDGSQVAFSDNDECLDCPIDAFDSVGVWLLDVATGQTSLVEVGGHQAQWGR